MLYVHGFSNLPEDVFAAAEETQGLCNGKKANEVLVVPVIWPCDASQGLVNEYWSDQKSADVSAFALARMFERFMEWRNSAEANPHDDPCTKRINVLAHSMGNRVLHETLSVWRKYDLADHRDRQSLSEGGNQKGIDSESEEVSTGSGNRNSSRL